MALTISYGSTVSGNTNQLYRYVLEKADQNPAVNYIVLVPEQMSLTVQKKLVENSPRKALFNVDVLTFNRLGYRVFEELSENVQKTVLDDTGKMMILRLVVSRNKDKLTVLKRNLNRNGFLDELKSIITELVQYNVTPEMLENQVVKNESHPMLKEKLGDIVLLYREFMEEVHKDYEMAEERTVHLARNIRKWEDLKNSVFVLDGFTGFTPPQYELLEELMIGGRDVVVGAVIGSGRTLRDNANEDAPFFMTAHMAKRLKQIAEKGGIRVFEEFSEEKENTVFAPEIRHLEENLYRYPRRSWEGNTERISILRAETIREEVTAVLSQIRKAIREGYEYRQLAVICSQPEDYADELEEQLTDADVPYFLDKARSLSVNPLVLLLTNVLAVIDERYSFDSVTTYMKNPLVLAGGEVASDDRLDFYERVCEVENYMLAMGIRGRAMCAKEWKKGYRNFAKVRLPFINETKTVIFEPLLKLTEKLTEKDVTIGRQIEALRDYLKVIRAEEMMEKLTEETEDPALKREYERSFEKLSGFFEETESILGEKSLSFQEFSDVLTAGLSDLKIGLVPPTMDCLVIGDLQRTRLGDIRKLFVMGANEGKLPKTVTGGGLLSEADREILKSQELNLAPDSKEETFTMQFYLYLLLTKPTESIMLTYAAVGNDGKSMGPSSVLREIREIFPSVRESKMDEGADWRFLTTENAGLQMLAGKIRDAESEIEKTDKAEVTKRTKQVYQWYQKDASHKEEMDVIRDAVNYRYRKETLSGEVTKRLFGDTLAGSVSRLEKYAGCAFAHFLRYGLLLEERQEYLLGVQDIGNLFHDSICRFFEKLKEKGLSWKEISTKTRVELTREAVEEVAGEYREDILNDSASNKYTLQRIQRISDRTLWALKNQWENGNYQSTESEVPFNGNNVPAMKMSLGDGLYLTLNGRIDRLDLAEDGSKIYVKVIDYKSSSKSLDMTKVYNGLQLQLLLYMEAATELTKTRNPGKEIVPGGIFYYHFDDPVVDNPLKGSEAADEVVPKIEKSILQELRMKGLTNREDRAIELLNGNQGSGAAAAYGLPGKGAHASTIEKNTAEPEQLRKLGEFSKQKAGELAKEILIGNIEVNPYSYNKEESCTYCEYRAICGFDDKIRGYKKKILTKKELVDIVGEESHG